MLNRTLSLVGGVVGAQRGAALPSGRGAGRDGERSEPAQAGAAFSGGEALVTPHKPANSGQMAYPSHFAQTPPAPFFCDWLSISQVHVNQDLPLVHAGKVISLAKTGEIEWESDRAEQFEGSHETSVRVSCDGYRVSLSGNVSGFGRPDNLFGLSLEATIRKASAIVGMFGLPAFTAGQEMPIFRKRNTGEVYGSSEYNGARIRRLDLTANYATGSLEDAQLYMQWLGGQQHSKRIKVGTYDNQTVDWGRGSRRLYAKAYIKSAQLRRLGKASSDVVQFCEDEGVVRFELTAKSTQLISMGCHTLGGLHMGHLINLFEDRRQVMTRATLDVDSLDTLPRALRCTARDYMAGDNLLSSLSERTFRRHRAGLLAFGIDIAVPSHVSQFRPKVRVVELRPVAVPDWYQQGLAA